MRIRYILTSIGIGSIVGIYESITWTFAPRFFTGLHPALIGITLLIAYDKPVIAYIFAGCIGIIADIFYVDGYTFSFGIYLCITFLLYILSKNIFTNHSVYATIALLFIGRILEYKHFSWQTIVYDIGMSSILFMTGVYLQKNKKKGGRYGSI